MGRSGAACGKTRSLIEKVAWRHLGDQSFCPNCEPVRLARESQEAVNKHRGILASQAVILTTTHEVEGRHALKYLGIESAEVVIGTGFLSELTGEIWDFLGERSIMFETKLAQAKRIAFDKLRLAAVRRGANAVIGVDLDYTEFDLNRVGVVVSGTLVLLTEQSLTRQ